ncbi:lantibiotic dehydratase [Streptomyces sp. NRRL WC-3742]|uniref:lantibiotic dehydratase n=1 Tax=Streptomyces sp. NRRL WC-3742 TaxID=1463934 RepID=UPI00068B693B|nr:lantibiotic dehydratase [Streptomyces sp. NRRL WC-3742]
MGKKTRGTARDVLFTATDPVLLRTPAVARLHRNAAGPGDEGPSAYLAEAAADPVLREAIEVSSPSLADVLDQAAAALGPAALHPAALGPAVALRPAAAGRAAEAVGRYRLRMATRPTPFGLMAAVATGRFDARAKVRWDGAERRTFRPDLGWLLPLLDRLCTEPQVLAGLRLAADQQVVLRGDRLVLPYLPERGAATGGDADAQPVTERTVRATAAVRAAVRHAARPLRHADLLAALAADFPAAPAEAITGLVRTLVAQGFLLTDLTPPPDSTDLLGHVLERLPDGHPVRAELASVRDLLAQAAASPRGQATTALREARRRMTRLSPADRPLHADLALDAEVVLPEQVRTELEHTATVLWRLSPPATAPEHLRAYHAEFVERYGTDSPVPLAELLDPDTGLGPPAGYRRPAGARGAATPQPARARSDADAARDRLLAELAAGALADREPGGPLPEVVLDDELLARLVLQQQEGGAADTPPASMELYAELAADSLDALDDGRFRLVLSPTAGSDRAGATFGRFAAQLGGGALLAAAAGLEDGEVLDAHLEFTPYRARHANIALTPRWLDHRVTVSAFPEDGGPAVIPLDDLVVLADTERLSVHSRSLGREIRATAHHALNLRTGAPNAARFLQEVALTGQRPWQPWDWGAAASAPALPRVRRGRVVLAPAAWRLTDPVPPADSPYEQWAQGLARWRRRWGVPAAVRLLSGDQRIGLDLDDPWHLRLLHSQARSGRPTVLQEDLAGDGGWLRGHVTELVVPLRRAARPADSPARRPLPAAHARTPELPGGPWLFARLAATEARHDEILADHLPRLLAALPGDVDRWFFIRYRDPAPHLRLRFHGTPPALAADLLPAVHDWAHDLRRAGLAADLRLDSYAPETDRYGGPDALAHAERVFHADSLVAVETLRLARASRTVPGALLAAVNLTGTARDFLAARAAAPPVGAWIAATYPKSEQHHQAFRTHRAAALRAIGPDGPATPGGGLLPADPALTAAWQERGARLTEYAAHLAPESAGPALTSLLHMGHNRLIGIDREAERRAYALARGALEAHRTRPTSTGEGGR